MKYLHVLYTRADSAACKGKGRGRGSGPSNNFQNTYKIYNLYSKPIFIFMEHCFQATQDGRIDSDVSL
jgi:hypothetical protein